MQRLLVAHSIPGLQRARAPKGHVEFAEKVTHIQVRDLSPYWNDCVCPCGWIQRRQFARHIDPENMFGDDEDDFQPYDRHTLETLLGPDDPTTHIEEDHLKPGDERRWLSRQKHLQLARVARA